ncbi:MAG: serine/threonine-protein kinase [Minicystis sp.]
MSVSNDPVQVGEIIVGRYRVERLLGRGAMGVVALATEIESGQTRAIKLLPRSAHANETAVERFFREARAMSRLTSEHAVRVYEAEILPSGAPYMVMEHLEGADLGDALSRRGALTAHEAADFVLQACEVLSDAHALGIVHRDLKPTNLFVTRRADGSTCIKVLDFGLAKALFPEEGNADLTLTNTVLGSPAYMSPEQLRSAKDVDPRSDIWSIGVVLYQLVTGRLPFRGRSATELIGQILVDTPEKPSSIRPGLPHALDAAILRCLEKQPEARYQSMRELGAALQPFVPPRPIAPTRPSAPEELAGPAPSPTSTPWALIIALTVVAALVALLLISMMFLR